MFLKIKNMKKLLLSLALVLCFTAAKATGFDFCLGPKIGYQTTTLSLDKTSIKSDFKDHFTAGVFGRLTIKNFIIQPELLWFRTGSVFNFDIKPEFNDGVALNPSVTLTQQRLALPIFLGYQLDGKLVKVRGNVGPVMYFKLDQKQSVDGLDESISMDNLETEDMTWGAALNVGVDVWKLTLDICYSFGLSNMFDDDDLEWHFNGREHEYPLDKTTQSMFTVTLGLKFL